MIRENKIGVIFDCWVFCKPIATIKVRIVIITITSSKFEQILHILYKNQFL